ncbi:MAG: transglutaminase-like protein [Acidobacteria bacterium]|nr:transglutaminase-like protein [Acidobacteriota bacterium]
MTRRGREVETLLLTALAAVPLYGTQTVGVIPVLLFHLAIGAIIVRVARGQGPNIVPEQILRAVALAYVPFYIVDAALISRSAIAASTHLVLFIAVYQPVESMRKNNQAQRLLTTALIFVASVATSTHITIVLYVLVFAFVAFRQLMYVSHMETVRSLVRAPLAAEGEPQQYAEVPSARAAGFYLCGTAMIGALLFPVLPRVRSPFVQGMAGSLNNATTGLSDMIDFNQTRTSTNDPAVVARIWMGQDAIPFFTPLRLRGAVYDRFVRQAWMQSRTRNRGPRQLGDGYAIARAIGFTRNATVQQRLARNTRLFVPAGTVTVRGLPVMWEGPHYQELNTAGPPTGRDPVTFDVSMARTIAPMPGEPPPHVVSYPVTPAVAALARQIIGGETDPRRQAQAIEQYMTRNFRYLARPESIGRIMSVDDFLLKDRRGHCEYFAAGMVALMSSLNVPARIVGGFYGGQLNPLTGYFVIRREDAHAWVEVWSEGRWNTFDPTPASLRPGAAQSDLLRLYATAISESITYFWDRYILTYGLADQIALMMDAITRARATLLSLGHGLSAATRQVTPVRVAYAAGFTLVLALLVALVLRRRRTLFDRLAEHLRVLGVDVGPATTVEEALTLLRQQQPEAARALEPVVQLYQAVQFDAHPSHARRSALEKQLRAL